MAEMVRCARCGTDCSDAYDYDEDSGAILCPVCVLEEDNCGCSDSNGGEE